MAEACKHKPEAQAREAFPRPPHLAKTRRGAILSMEMLFVLPVFVVLLLGLVEVAFLLSAQNQLQVACHQACRAGTQPTPGPLAQSWQEQIRQEVYDAADRVLHKPQLRKTKELKFEPGLHTGDPVRVKMRLPMSAAAPDLLAVFGFRLKGRYLYAECVMRKE